MSWLFTFIAVILVVVWNFYLPMYTQVCCKCRCTVFIPNKLPLCKNNFYVLCIHIDLLCINIEETFQYYTHDTCNAFYILSLSVRIDACLYAMFNQNINPQTTSNKQSINKVFVCKLLQVLLQNRDPYTGTTVLSWQTTSLSKAMIVCKKVD